jgi:hypothetical protein
MKKWRTDRFRRKRNSRLPFLSAFASDVLLENSGDLGHALWILIRAVTRRHNFFGFSAVQIQTPVGDDCVAAIR